jgi:hypothetical protein
MIRSLLGVNALAYLASFSVKKKTVLFVTNLVQNKLEYLTLIIFRLIQYLQVRLWVTHRVGTIMSST